MPSHSSVIYTEPNVNVGLWQTTESISGDGYTDDVWRPDDGFDRAPRLEDYCIALNLEVEVSSRDSQGTKDVLILQWSSDQKEGVSFMGGTKMGGYEVSGLNRKARIAGGQENLTTYYADMYVGDLINYGTTEMIGIKSVNIKYEKTCVPLIDIKFTDVRGLSLFQPTELSRNTSNDGIRGLNKDNVAQSFFQCFFRLPLPKFTFYIKGFYGKPVAYTMCCDKFLTNFNSETGDYDVDAHFIGYNYSFLTDIAFDALLAAPYSDFEGERYWRENIENGRFVLPDRYGTMMKPMPTLYEIYKDYNELIKTTNSGEVETAISSEEMNHEEEIEKLRGIRERYNTWYSNLFYTLSTLYGKKYCFEFRESFDKDSDWYRILILTNDSTNENINLKEAYTQYPDSFKQINNDLYSLIEDFNSSGNGFKQLKNISKDFSDYTKVKLFNDCYVNRNTRKVEFGGFHRDFSLKKSEIINRLFYNRVAAHQVNNEKMDDKYKDYVLHTIYGDGVNQYKNAYIINVDYSDISRRINALVEDSKKSYEQKEKDKRRKEHNRIMLSKMSWYPSIENTFKVIMAHVETYMAMMYRVKEACKSRTPEDVGVSIGENGSARDVNSNAKILPPFPKIIADEMGEDGIVTEVDRWVGDIEGDAKFIEADMVNGLFNGIGKVYEMYEKDSQNSGTPIPVSSANGINPSVKYPLTSYDFFMTKELYGTDTDVANNPNAFAGKVALRMYNILAFNNFKNEYGDKWSYGNSKFIENLGKLEAENFYHSVKITNEKLLQMLGVENETSLITPQSIIDCVVKNMKVNNSDTIPWENKNDAYGLFDLELIPNHYNTSNRALSATTIYPLQNISFNALKDSLTKFNKGSIDADNEDIAIDWIDVSNDKNIIKILSSPNKSVLGSTYIIDDYKSLAQTLEQAASNTEYKEIYDLIRENSIFNKDEYKKTILTDGVFRPKLGLISKENAVTCKIEQASANTLSVIYDENTMKIGDGNKEGKYVFDNNKLDDLMGEIENNSISSWFFTECRGYNYDAEDKKQPFHKALYKSLFGQKRKEFLDDVYTKEWLKGTSQTDKHIGFFLMSLDAIDYTSIKNILGSKKTFVYLPKLAVLQIGAALASLTDIKKNINSIGLFTSKMIVPKDFFKIANYLERINYTTRLAYIKYFRDWVLKYNSDINNNLFRGENKQIAVKYIKENGEKTERVLFKEDSAFINGLSDLLMTPVLVVKGNINHYRNFGKNVYKFSAYNATSFLNGFLERIRELYKVPEKGGHGIKLAAEPSSVTISMKRELYRYLKLVYERWIPSTEQNDWQFETFFNAEEEAKIRSNGAGGHLFHFIDSYYNKIGDKFIINPKTLSEYISKAITENNVNTVLMGFIGDIMQYNKCLFYTLQNFADLADKESMSMMFRPIPYNSMRGAKKHPDFVVVYPYQPSRYLNVDNGDFKDDSFMLNEEYATPLAIRSRGADEKGYYRVPAFGVSYGKQYQSYFKKINVDMSTPIASEQAIRMKHSILRESREGAKQGSVAHDVYDIYSTQSYTCQVEMMGCAWVQPLMYFVLTNVPLFRGSYMIFSVTHSITPGNMTTIFKGARMANTAMKIDDEIFTDFDEEPSTESSVVESTRNALADVDNDCPYKVYPLFEADGVTLTSNQVKKGNEIMSLLMGKGFNKIAAAGVVGNICQECKFDHTTADIDSTSNGYVVGGICGWNDKDGNLTSLAKNNTSHYGQEPINRDYGKTNVSGARKMLAEKGLDYQINFMINTLSMVRPKISIDTLNNCATPEAAAEHFRASYEKGTAGKRALYARKFYDNYNGGTMTTKAKVEPNKKDIASYLIDAVQKSINSTNAKQAIKKGDSIKGYTNIIGSGDRMDLVFDIILNGYYDYVQELIWVCNGSGDLKGKPVSILVNASEKPKPQSRMVGICGSSSDGILFGQLKKVFGSGNTDINESFLKSIKKKYGAVNKHQKPELPQFGDSDIFKSIEVKDCDTMISSNSGGNAQTPSEVGASDNGSIDGWNVGKAVQWLFTYSRDGYYDGCKSNSPRNSSGTCKGLCATYVLHAIKAGGIPFNSEDRLKCGLKGGYATNLRYNGILKEKGFVMIEEGTVSANGDSRIKLQSGDIAIIGYDAQIKSSKYHACMYTSKGWYSDYKQSHMNPYSSSWPYAIYRYHNKQKT